MALPPPRASTNHREMAHLVSDYFIRPTASPQTLCPVLKAQPELGPQARQGRATLGGHPQHPMGVMIASRRRHAGRSLVDSHTPRLSRPSLARIASVSGLFHVDLIDSIAYAGVPVQYTLNGKTRCQGYIPTIVSKCGWFLKEKATRTQGIFRVSGSAKRVAELQLLFDTPPKYGSQLDWTGYTMHDASNVLRRYLNHLPDPVIPLEFYEKFRDVHRNLTNDDEKIATYQELISKLPPPHSCLLMYLLDLLALFAHHSDENLMDAKNLASVFQPGVISHPNHAMSPGEYMTSAAVLKFLIDHQSSFTMPTPSLDEDDEEMANFGLMGHSHHGQHIGPGFHGGYVSAADHERLHGSMGVSFDEEDALHVAGVRRQLSLHKPIIPHSTLPGSTPQRSKSTNSTTSSHHSGQSGLFSSTFMTRKRSNRNSRSGSRTLSGIDYRLSLEGPSQDQDLAGIPERPISDRTQATEPMDASIRRSITSPPKSEEFGEGLESSPSRRRHLRGENRREPSVILQTVEIQFQAPTINSGNQEPFKPSASAPTSLKDRNSQTWSESSTRGLQRSSTTPTNTLVYTPNPPARQHDGATPPPNQAQKRASNAGQIFPTPPEQPAAASQRPVNTGMPILRAKSNPGDLAILSSSPHSSGSQAIEKFKGLFTGKNRDSDSSSASKDSDSKDTKKEKKRESLTDKQRKYRSQDWTPTHLQGSAPTGSRKPSQSTIIEHENVLSEGAYMRPPPPRPQQLLQQQLGAPPQRPPPPPPEGSLLDILDPPRADYHSSESSRSASPARTQTSSSSSSRPPLLVNTSFTTTSSARSALSATGDRPQHVRGLPSHGSSSSLEFLITGNHGEDGQRTRQYLSRPGHSPQGDHLISPQAHSRPQYNNRSHSPNTGHDGVISPLSGRPSDPLLSSHLSSRSRQGSFGSMDSYDPSVPPSLGPKSRNRRSTREGSISSLRGDVTPPRARSRNTSPAPSPSLAPSGRITSTHGGPSHHGYHGSSPLAEGHGGGHAFPSPSTRARARAQSRDELHLLHRQESAPTTPVVRPQYERERSRSTAGLAITMPLNASAPGPMSANVIGGQNNSSVSLASSSKSAKSGRQGS